MDTLTGVRVNDAAKNSVYKKKIEDSVNVGRKSVNNYGLTPTFFHAIL